MCLLERNCDMMDHPVLLQSLLAADAHHLSANQTQEQEQGLHRQHDTTRCSPAYQHSHASQYLRANHAYLGCVQLCIADRRLAYA